MGTALSSTRRATARQLLAAGNADERWEATAVLRDAAREELPSCAAGAGTENERAAALVEACRLFLEARDPVRAIETWALLPAAAFAAPATEASAPDAGAVALPPVAAIQSLYGAVVPAFSSAVREVFGAGFSEASLHADQIRALADVYPGVPELWWALSRRSPSPGERDLCRARATRLSPASPHDPAACDRLEYIESRITPRLRIEMSPERRGARLSLAVSSRIAAALASLVTAFTEKAHLGHVELVPDGPAANAPSPETLALEVTAEGLHPFALEDLDRELGDTMPRASARPQLTLFALLREHGVRLSVTHVAPRAQPGLFLDPARCRALFEAADAAARGTLDSKEIPQADDIERVFRAVERLVAGADGPPDISPRQLSYYRRAAKILGLLTESDEPTPAGKLIARLDPEERLRAGAFCFESSICGEAWIRWSGGRTLLDVSPKTAADFLRASVPGLSKDTADRRAQTLAAWHRALATHHYAHPPSSPP